MPVRSTQPVNKWSIQQAARWIKFCIRKGSYGVIDHAFEEANNDDLAMEEILECILIGQISHLEPGENRATRLPDMRVRFTLDKKLKSISAVVAVSDHDPNCVVITVWAKKKKIK